MKKRGTRLLSVLISGLLLLSSFPMSAAAAPQQSPKAAPQRLLGDVNGDEVVNSADAMLISRYSVKLIDLTEEQLTYADVNQDGKVNSGDAQLISRYSVRIYDEIGTTTVALDRSTLTLRVGDSSALNAKLSNNPCHDRIVRWESDNPKIASVDANGTVTGNTSGRATITATLFNGQKDSCVVTVSKDRYDGIDVSQHQGAVDWNKVKAAGNDFAMIRASQGSYDPDDDQRDPYFGINVVGATNAGLDVGAYHYSYFTTVEVAIQEADYFLSVLEPYREYITYPVVLDIEADAQKTVSKAQLTKAARAFCDRVRDAGYYVMIYANVNFMVNYLDYSQLDDYDLWLAHFGVNKPGYEFHDIWQYTETGTVNGVSGYVDRNYGYKDYHSLLNDLGLPSDTGYNPPYYIKTKGRCKPKNGMTAYSGPDSSTGAAFYLAQGEEFEFFGKNSLSKPNPYCLIRNSKGQLGWVRWNDVERF